MTALSRYVVIDTETTALKPAEGYLLTCALMALDKDFNELRRLELKLKHDPYDPNKVSARALEVNGLTMESHNAGAEDKEIVLSKIHAFFEACKPFPLDYRGATIGLTPMAHNWIFDKGWIEQALPEIPWDEYLHYHYIDTCVGAGILKGFGILPESVGVSLVYLTKHFGLPHKAHDAMGDVEACLAVFKQLRWQVNPKLEILRLAAIQPPVLSRSPCTGGDQ